MDLKGRFLLLVDLLENEERQLKRVKLILSCGTRLENGMAKALGTTYLAAISFLARRGNIDLALLLIDPKLVAQDLPGGQGGLLRESKPPNLNFVNQLRYITCAS